MEVTEELEVFRVTFGVKEGREKGKGKGRGQSGGGMSNIMKKERKGMLSESQTKY